LKTIDISTLAVRRGVAPKRAQESVKGLVKSGRVRLLSEQIVVSPSVFAEAMNAVSETVKRFHEANPISQGIGREELKARLFGDASSILFQAILDQLVADKRIAVDREVIHQFGRKVTLGADEERIRTQLSAKFRSLGLQVSPANEIIDALKFDRTMARKIIQLMLKENELVKINEELMIGRAAIDQLIADLRGLKAKTPKIGVSEFKTLTGVTRKHAIPLLEYLDRQRVTRRVGDERLIL